MDICSVAYNLKFFGLLQQNNLSNPPTPPASLPPTPPPMACQKMANGFATTEELAGKAGVLVSHEGMITYTSEESSFESCVYQNVHRTIQFHPLCPPYILWFYLFAFPVARTLGPKPFQVPFRPQDDLLARAIAQGPKTVDVPASLPTPPHNNHEELR